MIAAAMLAAASASAGAEDSGAPAGAKRFHALLGKWQGSGTLSGGEQPVRVSLSYACDRAAAGWGIACVLTGKGNGVELSESDLMGVDPVTGAGHWFAVTNQGETHDHLVTWNGDEGFRAHYAWQQDGRRMIEDITVDFAGGHSVEFHSAVSADGQEVGSFSGKLVR